MKLSLAAARRLGIRVPSRSPGAPAASSPLEDYLAQQLFEARVTPPERQYRFSDARGFVADFAWPRQQLIVEVQGGTRWGRSRHSYGAGFDNDCEKAAEAARLGYRLVPVSSAQVRSGRAAQLIQRVLAGLPIWKETERD